MNKVPCFLLLFFLNNIAFTQSESYKIVGNIKDLKTNKCFLGYYFASQKDVIYVDTAQVDLAGNFEFTGQKHLSEGLYFIEFPAKKRLDLVVGAVQSFRFSTDFLHLTDNIVFQNSEENTQYYSYIKYVRPRQAALRTALTVEQSTKIQQELVAFQTKFFQEKNGYLSSSILGASEMPYIQTFTLPNGKNDEVKVYHYYKNHFFDNINLTDERLLRTNLIEAKLTEYIEKLTYQVPDSAIKSMDALMQKTAVGAFRKYFVSKMTAYYKKNSFIGAENVYVHLLDKYYIAEPNLWDAPALKQTAARANTLRPLLLGKTIPNMVATATDGKEYALHDTQARYTILYIYSLDCSHCQEHAPKIAALQAKLAAKGAKFYAIAVEHDETKWKNFIAKYHTQNLHNLIDKKHQIDFIKDYDVIEYPTNFVLDANKKIVGKHINPALLEDFLKYLDGK